MTDEIESPDAGEPSDSPTPKELRLERKKEAILTSVAEARLNTLQTQVAWLLNHIPETRDSDITLQLRYWEQFESDIYSGGMIQSDDLYRLKRLTSLSRARASIQNTHGLFLASDEVRKRRGTLEEEETDSARYTAREVRKSFSVYADESGRTSDYLIVGSLWLLNGLESREISESLARWREARQFSEELHFSSIGRGSVVRYLEVLDLLHGHAAALSFKAIVLPRRGLSDQDSALRDMLYHLLIRGVSHEEASGRATLPRTLQLWKDAENKSADDLALANLKDRLSNTSSTMFDDRLTVTHLFAQDSKTNPFLQVADLFVSSVNRRLVRPDADGSHPKDLFAGQFLERFGVRRGEGRLESGSDVVVFEDV